MCRDPYLIRVCCFFCCCCLWKFPAFSTTDSRKHTLRFFLLVACCWETRAVQALSSSIGVSSYQAGWYQCLLQIAMLLMLFKLIVISLKRQFWFPKCPVSHEHREGKQSKQSQTKQATLLISYSLPQIVLLQFKFSILCLLYIYN